MNAVLLQATRWLPGIVLMAIVSMASAQPVTYTLTTLADKLDSPWSLVQLMRAFL